MSTSKRAFTVREQKPQPYFSFDDQYPEYIQVQRTVGVITGNRVTFNADTFDPNLFLRSRAYIKLTVDIQRSDRVPATGVLTATNYNAADVIIKKPGLVLANSMTNAKLRINSTEIEYNNPRYWQQHITQQHCGRTLNDKYLSTSGSSYPHYTGIFNPDGTMLIDNGSDFALAEGIDSAFRDIGDAAADTKSFEFMELLNIGCFNFMEDKKNDVYSKSWYRRMTPLIPYIRQIGLTLDFKDIAANSLLFQFGLHAQAAATRNVVLRDVAITSAELVLTWVKPRINLVMDIPPTIQIQSWYVDHKIFPQVNAADGAAIVDVNTLMAIDETITIHQIPTYIHIWATINKDDPVSYDCRSVVADNAGGTQETRSLSVNSQESRGLPSQGLEIRVNILGGDSVLSNAYNVPEMYRFTTKNSIKDFPWSETKFAGDFPSKYAAYPSQFSLIMGEADLNSYFVRKGQTIRDFVIAISGDMRANDGYGIDRTAANFATGGSKQWDLHVAFFYDRYYVEIDNCGNGYSDFDARFF